VAREVPFPGRPRRRESCRPARRARTCATYLPGQEANNIEAQVTTMLR
jgi:hypothetical protein